MKRPVLYIFLFSSCAVILFLLYKWTDSAPYHRLTIAITAVFLTFLLFSIFSSRKREEFVIPDKDKEKDKEIQFHVDLVETWKTSNLIYVSIHHFLSGMSIYCSIITVFIATSDTSDPRSIVIYSILSIVSAVLDLSFTPLEYGYGYRLAYEKASDAFSRYFDGSIAWKEVLDAIKEGEKIITQKIYNR